MKYGRKTTSVARMKAAKEMSDSDGSPFADVLSLLGMGAGAVVGGLKTGGLGAMKGAAIGGSLGQGLGSMLTGAKEKDVARMGSGAVGLANLATDKRSADIIRKLLGGPAVKLEEFGPFKRMDVSDKGIEVTY